MVDNIILLLFRWLLFVRMSLGHAESLLKGKTICE